MRGPVGRLQWRIVLCSGITLLLLMAALLAPERAHATPQFARQYRVDCNSCHTHPPAMNERGEQFSAGNYRLDDWGLMPAHRTLPLAAWTTVDLERQSSARTTKVFPSRIELISQGRIGRSEIAYFIEWRVLSQQVGGNNRILDRSGRFEDLYLAIPLAEQTALSVTVGQFRALNQIDVSRRLGISEPMAFSAGVHGDAAISARLTSLRAFSPSGRQPAIRLAMKLRSGPGPADGWHSLVTLPITGELTIPLADASSFELEARPKGVFLENYYQHRRNSIGGHLFLGDGRSLGNLVLRGQIRERTAFLGALGFTRRSGASDLRYSAGGEFAISSNVAAGLRIDHRTKQGRDPLIALYANGHIPFGPARFRQAMRVQLEQRQQSGNNVTVMSVSHVM